ncbi:MAG TPA: protease pro-enzyme activation domain-containing protein, partial [Nakamurella sp.]
MLVPVLIWASIEPALADPAPPRTVVETPPAWTAQAPVVGDVPADQTQHLSVALNLRDEAGADALATAVSDPTNSQYRQFITASDWRSRFAPTDDAVAQVTTWLTSQGFSIGTIPANHRYIPFSGSTAQVQAAFGTSVRVFDKDGQATTAPAAPVSVPASIAGFVAGVGGLDTSAVVRPDHLTGADDNTGDGSGGAGSRSAAPQSVAPQSVAPQTASPQDTLPPPPAVFKNAGPCSDFYGQKSAARLPQILPDPLTYAPCGYKPVQLRGAYGIDQYLARGIDGRGATVAITDAYASPTILADAQRYSTRNDPQHPLRSYQFSQSLPATYRYTAPD